MPAMFELCNKKLGISQKIASFALPVGIQFNMTGACFYLAMPTALMIKAYGIEWTTDLIFTLIITIFMMSITMPMVAGAAIICLSSTFSAIGVPIEAVAIFLCIDIIVEMIGAVSCTTSDTLSTFILARSENMVDENIYTAKS